MKINKKFQAAVEWVIAILLIFLCIRVSGLTYGSFSPLKAHQQSEKTFHYGPSEIIKEIDIEKGKIYLCKYKEWFSSSTVIKRTIKWYIGDGQGGRKIEKADKISYSWNGSRIHDYFLMKVYGYVSEESIDKVLLDVELDGLAKTLEYKLEDDRMFIFYWDEEVYDYKLKELRGVDKSGKVIYSKDL